MFNKICDWAKERNLVEGSTPQAQMVKLVEEIGELASGIAKKNDDVIKDSIGDAIVVLTIIAAQYDLNMDDCIQAAYDEIKDRKGKMIDGVFVKEADLVQELRYCAIGVPCDGVKYLIRNDGDAEVQFRTGEV